ncbi:MAG: carbohydrate porin [Planctomycetota bacterium]
MQRVTLLLIAAAPAVAQEPGGHAASDALGVELSPRWSLTRDPMELRRAVEANDGRFLLGGLSIVGQAATETTDGRGELVNATFDVTGAVQVFGGRGEATGILTAWVRGGRPVGASADADLGASLGSDLDINASLENETLYVRELFWGQWFGDEFAMSLGRIDPTFRHDFNAMANNEWEQFIATPLVNSSAIPFPDPGFGVDSAWEPNSRLGLYAGLYQSNSSFDSVEDIRSDALFASLEARAFSPFRDWIGEGTYRLLVYRSDVVNDDSVGVSLSLDQQVAERVVPFLRATFTDRDGPLFRSSVSFGLGILDPLGWTDDLVGVGYATADPRDADRRREHLVETFYRFQFGRYMNLTPHVQLVLDPARNPETDAIGVFGLRVHGTL